MKTIVASILIVSGLSGLWFGKLHRTREVEVVNCYNNIVTVQHPNGLTYKFNSLCDNEYIKGQHIKVVFDELTDWEKDYRIVDIVK